MSSVVSFADQASNEGGRGCRTDRSEVAPSRFPRSKSAAPQRRCSFDSWVSQENLQYAGVPATQRNGRDRDWTLHFHDAPAKARAKSVGRERERGGDIISHEHGPIPFKPQKKLVIEHENSGSAGVKTPNRFTRGFLSGYEDLLPAGTRKTCKADLPPSEEYIRSNETKILKPVPQTPKKHVKSDLPPSDDLKLFNEKKAHEKVPRAPINYTVGDMPPSTQLKTFNDNQRLHGSDRPTPSLAVHAQKFTSDNMRHCLVPPTSCSMSDRFSRTSYETRDSCISSDSGMEPPQSARSSQAPSTARSDYHRKGSSDASSKSGAGPLSARSSQASSVTASDRYSVDRERLSKANSNSEASLSSGYQSATAASHRSNRRGSAPSVLSPCVEEDSNDVSTRSQRRGSLCSDASSSYCNESRGASERGSVPKFSPPARSTGCSSVPKSRMSARSSCVSDASSSVSASTACSASCATSKGGGQRRDGPLLSVCSSQNSFSFGGFSFDKITRRD